MSTILNTEGTHLEIPALPTPDFKCAVVVAKWNSKITGALRDGALDVFEKAGVKAGNIKIIEVPGTVELVYAAAKVMDNYDAVVVVGCVIRGDTPHFDYVCQHTTQGVSMLNAKGTTPVIFGVLTTENLQQAEDRAGGCLGNKGSEAAVAAIEMAKI